MDIVTLILLLIAILLIILAKNKTDEANEKAQRTIELQNQEIEDLKRLRLQEVHNNTVLVNENRELIKAVKELDKLSKTQQCNSVKNLQNKMQSIIKELFANNEQDK